MCRCMAVRRNDARAVFTQVFSVDGNVTFGTNAPAASRASADGILFRMSITLHKALPIDSLCLDSGILYIKVTVGDYISLLYQVIRNITSCSAILCK